jgi:hypothetical protein
MKPLHFVIIGFAAVVVAKFMKGILAGFGVSF